MFEFSKSFEINSFVGKFDGLNSAAFGLEGYPAAYCDHLLSSLYYYSAIYKYIIDLAVREAKKPIKELSVLDYGTGNGFLGMFAKHRGFDRVWTCDISESFLKAAKKTATPMKINIEDFILGDINHVQKYFKNQGTKPDILLATDVIEHIYDIDSFFASLKELNPNLICVFTTASNPYNYYKVRQLHKLQYKDEWVGYKDLPEQELQSKGFSQLAFYEQRKKIIQVNFPWISNELAQELAQNTRGKKKDDVIRDVNDFLTNGEKIIPPKDFHWVCDPETGSWTERILPINFYEKLFKKQGFTFSISNGFYDEFSNRRTKSLIRFLNRQIGKHQYLGKYLAPFIVFLGVSSMNSKT